MDDATLTKLINDAASAGANKAATLVHQDAAGTYGRVVDVLADCVALMKDMDTLLTDVEVLPGRLDAILAKIGTGSGGTVNLAALAAQVAPLLQLTTVRTAASAARAVRGNAESLIAELTAAPAAAEGGDR